MKDLQINESPAFQEWFWRVQRFVWALLGLLLVAALLGLTGGGALSFRVIAKPEFTLEYPAIMRQKTSERLTFTISAPAPEVVLRFDAAFGERFAISAMTPAPTAEQASAEGVDYKFTLSGPGQKTIHITLTSDQPGWASYAIAVNGQSALLSTLVLP